MDDAGRHIQRHAGTDTHDLVPKHGFTFAFEEGEAFFYRVRVHQNTLSGLQPLLSNEESLRTNP